MSPREPTRDELLAMAYVDGELAPEERADFERRLAVEEPLRREVALLERLAVIARASRPREPMDFEWERLRRDPLQRAGGLLAWVLLGLGSLGLLAWAVVRLLGSDLERVPKILILAALSGLALLFAVTLRARLRTRRYDPYGEIER